MLTADRITGQSAMVVCVSVKYADIVTSMYYMKYADIVTSMYYMKYVDQHCLK